MPPKQQETTPRPYAPYDPPLLVPEFRNFGREQLPAVEFARHTFSIGGSGSGKTESCIRPLLRASLRYPERSALTWSQANRPSNDPLPAVSHLRHAVMIVDPKQELAETAEAEAVRCQDRELYHFGPGHNRYVHLFEGMDLDNLDASTAAEALFGLSDYAAHEAGGRDPFWSETCKHTATGFIAVDKFLSKQSPGGIHSFWEGIRHQALREGLISHQDELPAFDPADPFQVHVRFMAACGSHAGGRNGLVSTYLERCAAAGVPRSLTTCLQSLEHLAENTATSLVIVYQSISLHLVDPALTSCLWLSPYEPPPPERTLSLARLIAEGHAVLYAPAGGVHEKETEETIGRAPKSVFFRLSLSGKSPIRGVAYICDEAQRFFHSAPKASEAHFLDVGRAYRAGAVLATQSTA